MPQSSYSPYTQKPSSLTQLYGAEKAERYREIFDPGAMDGRWTNVLDKHNLVNETRIVYRKYLKAGAENSLLEIENGMGHSLPNANTLTTALEFLDWK